MAAPTPRRWRFAHELGADCVRALHRRVRGVHHRSACGRGAPQDAPHLLRRDARDDRRGLPQAGHALCRVRAPPTGALHVRSAFTWEVGTWVGRGGPRHGTMPSSEPSCRTCPRPRSPSPACRTARNRRQTVPPGSRTPTINVDMIVQNASEGGITDISFTVPHSELDPALEICEAKRSEIGAASVTADPRNRQGQRGGRRHEVQPRCGGTMFETLAEHGINIEMISTSAIRISCVVAESDRRSGRAGAARRLRAGEHRVLTPRIAPAANPPRRPPAELGEPRVARWSPTHPVGLHERDGVGVSSAHARRGRPGAGPAA